MGIIMRKHNFNLAIRCAFALFIVHANDHATKNNDPPRNCSHYPDPSGVGMGPTRTSRQTGRGKPQ